MRNAHSTGDLQQASTQQEGQRRPAALGPQPSWPLPCVWTSTTQVGPLLVAPGSTNSQQLALT